MKTYLPIEGMPKCCMDCEVSDHSHMCLAEDLQMDMRPADCPLVQMPTREEAEAILGAYLFANSCKSATKIHDKLVPEILTKLGYKEDK